MCINKRTSETMKLSGSQTLQQIPAILKDDVCVAKLIDG